MARSNEAEWETYISGLTPEELKEFIENLEDAVKLKQEQEIAKNAEIRAKEEEKYKAICTAAKAERDEVFRRHPVKNISDKKRSRTNTSPTRSVVRGNQDIPTVMSDVLDVCHEFDNGQSYRDAVKLPIKTYTRSLEPHTKTIQKKGKQKGAEIVIHNDIISASTVSDLYQQALNYLIDSDLLDRIEMHIPYETSPVRFLIATSPYHQRGNEFRSPVEYKGYYMEAHKDYDNALRHLSAFLKTCGVSVEYR